ncbi:MAG: histidinol-phosphatase HisJ family protein [Lachnospiraceae bacterium]|nr:histidinol-phosphatase HisJ family protein [Lachnospiraceae bacterium]
MLGDCHVHSRYSADSEADPEETIRKAVKRGLPLLCFTDHIDYDYPVEDLVFDYDVNAYFEELQRLRDKYADQIKVLIGVELGMQTHLGPEYTKLLEQHPFDYVIGSQHLVNRMDPYYPETFEGKTDAEIFRSYFEETLEDVKAFHEFDSMGHLDYIVRYGRKKRRYNWHDYADIIDEILKLLVRYNIALEINTAGIRKQMGAPNPQPEILHRYRELGGTLVTVGSDSHKPDSLGFAFDTAKEILKTSGFTHYVYYEKRRPVFVSLNDN